MPAIIKECNKSMGGVDLFDRLRGLYRTCIRNKRWYYPLIRFCLNGAMVNAWMLYRQIHKDMRLVEFIRRCVIAILATPAIDKPKGVKPKVHRQIMNEVRNDNIGHLVDAIEKQRKLALCKKCTTFCCVKCNVGSHTLGSVSLNIIQSKPHNGKSLTFILKFCKNVFIDKMACLCSCMTLLPYRE